MKRTKEEHPFPPTPPPIRLIKDGVEIKQPKGVYCCDCDYSKEVYLDKSCYCKAPTGKIIKDYIRGDYKEKYWIHSSQDDYPNNKDTNGCTLYKRKWWKFWR